jgi:hypothetical protein
MDAVFLSGSAREPHSVGHYVDLSSAVLGVTLLALAVGVRMIRAGSSVL